MSFKFVYRVSVESELLNVLWLDIFVFVHKVIINMSYCVKHRKADYGQNQEDFQ